MKKKLRYTGFDDINGNKLFEGDTFKNCQADVNTIIEWGGEWCYENFHARALPLNDGTEKIKIENGNRLND